MYVCTLLLMYMNDKKSHGFQYESKIVTSCSLQHTPHAKPRTAGQQDTKRLIRNARGEAASHRDHSTPTRQSHSSSQTVRTSGIPRGGGTQTNPMERQTAADQLTFTGLYCGFYAI